MNKKDALELLILSYLNDDISFDELHRMASVRSSKAEKDEGAIYTPRWIADTMVEQSSLSITDRWIEPSVGHGAFWFAALRKLSLMVDTNFDWACWMKNHVRLSDIDGQSIEDLKRLTKCWFFKEIKVDIPLEDMPFYEEDGLDAMEKHGPWDLVLGNPPYIRTRLINPMVLETIRSKYAACKKGNIDLYYAFVAASMQHSKKSCLIVPNSFLTNKSGQTLKSKWLDGVVWGVDFGAESVFENASTYTCMFLWDSEQNSSDYIWQKGRNGTPEKQKRFNEITHAFDEECRVYSGIATLADRIFQVGSHQKPIAIHEGRAFPLEKGMIVPFFKWTTWRPGDAVKGIIYPYRKKAIISEAEMMTDFPETYGYLSASKNRLLGRDKGKTQNYEAWYAYGRKQGMHDLKAGKYLIIPQMIGGNSQPFVMDISKWLMKGPILFSSGYMIPLDQSKGKPDEAWIKAAKTLAKQEGKPWPGKEEDYFSLTTPQIKKGLYKHLI